MEVVGGPVRRDVAAVPPDRSHFHAAERAPDVLARRDVAAVDDDPAVGRDDAIRQRRRLLIYADAGPAEHGERREHDEGESKPETFHARRLRSMSSALGNRMLFSRCTWACRSVSNASSSWRHTW